MKDERMNIERVGPPYAGVLAEIHVQAFDQPWDEASMLSALVQPGAFALLAHDDAGEPLGFVLLRVAGDEAEVLTIATLPKARRRGVARILMEDACEVVRERGASRVFLEVADDNTAARGLYDRLGFTQVGLRRGYYTRTGGARVDARVLALDL